MLLIDCYLFTDRNAVHVCPFDHQRHTSLHSDVHSRDTELIQGICINMLLVVKVSGLHVFKSDLEGRGNCHLLRQRTGESQGEMQPRTQGSLLPVPTERERNG